MVKPGYIKSFLLVKVKVGKEEEAFNQLFQIPEIREIHFIPGDFDILCVLETEESLVYPWKKVTDLIMGKIRKMDNLTDTKTIIPFSSKIKEEVSPPRENMVKAFVFVEVEPGKEKNIMRKIFELKNVREVHFIPGKADILTILEVEKGIVTPHPEKILEIVLNDIRGIRGVKDTETLVPDRSEIKES
ncbi:MAG: hypothetical protein DRO36_03745 [Candidatus Hecatellales archaeon]|mgnify:CR=1 FL=1|nr:MAG: hypothetical protein DRO36_03745 [Candidatus Hecatellales archaeon]